MDIHCKLNNKLSFISSFYLFSFVQRPGMAGSAGRKTPLMGSQQNKTVLSTSTFSHILDIMVWDVKVGFGSAIVK